MGVLPPNEKGVAAWVAVLAGCGVNGAMVPVRVCQPFDASWGAALVEWPPDCTADWTAFLLLMLPKSVGDLAAGMPPNKLIGAMAVDGAVGLNGDATGADVGAVPKLKVEISWAGGWVAGADGWVNTGVDDAVS